METKLFSLLPLFSCAHEFSWPRRWADGEYYQVCLRCGAEYQYDWSSMQRRQARKVGEEKVPAARPLRGSQWRPRARRLRVDLPVQVRNLGQPEWHSGTIRNISKSGVLLSVEDLPKAGSDLELIFEMPKEISGQEGSKVVSRCKVVRVSQETHRAALTITDYRFLHQ